MASESIRKVSVGPDYKNEAMHYIVGQSVLRDTHKVHAITNSPDGVLIHVENDKGEVILWKTINKHMPVVLEHNLDF